MSSPKNYSYAVRALIMSIAAINISYAEQSNNSMALEEVIVTAQKKTESLQDAPISLIAFGSEKIEQLGISDVGDIQGAVPNLSTAPHPSNRNSLTAFIRGVGNADLQITKDPAVGVYLDGVYLGRSAGLTADIADVQAIEVLRGPQGTLYGRNTTGGAISIRSAQADEEFSLKQKFSKGNRGYWRTLTQVNLPITDTVMVRAAFSRSAEDGLRWRAGVPLGRGDRRGHAQQDGAQAHDEQAEAEPRRRQGPRPPRQDPRRRGHGDHAPRREVSHDVRRIARIALSSLLEPLTSSTSP